VGRLALRSGLDDATVRAGHRPAGIWVPECAVAPGVETLLAAEGVRHVLVDQPTITAAGGSTDRVSRAGGVVVLGRDLRLTDQVWSARSG
jgi:1,4-alpha-glucan branching enzyme